MRALLFLLPFFVVHAVAQTALPGADSTIASTEKKPSVMLELAPPAAFVTYGFSTLVSRPLRFIDRSVQADRMEDLPAFGTRIDNYLQYTPLALSYAAGFAGVKSVHSLMDRTALAVASHALMNLPVSFLKRNVGRLRPNGIGTTSFPSGHTANAFVGAEILWQEYHDESAWYGIAGYGIATATGILRVYNNAHWFSDVVTGAGFGILSTKIVYLVYPRLKAIVYGKRQLRLLVTPVQLDGKPGLMFRTAL